MKLAVVAFGLALIGSSAFGQKIYKCPDPDGKAIYQQKECPEGARMSVRDTGASSGGQTETVPLQDRNSAPAAGASPAQSGLREGEKEMLRDARQKEADDANRRAEFAKARAIEAHQQEVRNLKQQMHEDNMMRLQLLKESMKRR